MIDIEFLSAEQVCDIQKATLSGAPPSNMGLIDGAVNRVVNEYIYNGTSDILQLAAWYLVAIAKAHAFPDANKRTAYQSALMFLDLNGVYISESDQLLDVTVRAAEGNTTIQEIIEIFHQNIDM